MFDKINLIIVSLFLFILVFYALSFYPLIFNYSQRRSAETILVRSVYGRNSFF